LNSDQQTAFEFVVSIGSTAQLGDAPTPRANGRPKVYLTAETGDSMIQKQLL